MDKWAEREDMIDRWGWDSTNVKMPCSPHNKLPRRTFKETTKWQLIERKFKEQIPRTILTSFELEEIIFEYNSTHRHNWKFDGLHEFSIENRLLYHRVIPKITKMALSLPHVMLRPLPLLRQGHASWLSLTQVQIAAILANAFLCTFPCRHAEEYSNYASINFNGVFKDNTPGNVEKLKYLFNYFEKVHDYSVGGMVSFVRRHVHERSLPNWRNSRLQLTKLQVASVGSVEDRDDMLMVESSSKLIGGRALDSGEMQQDEVRLFTNPELLVARLFTEQLQKNEALLVIGSECYSEHSDSAGNYQYCGDYCDVTRRDRLTGRRQSALVFLDALNYSHPEDQYLPRSIHRELNKAYVGFHAPDKLTKDVSGVATGNWGCGEQNGDPEMKLLIQLMAATLAQRPLVRYFTDGDEELTLEATTTYNLLLEKRIPVGQLCRLLESYGDAQSDRCQPSLFMYLHQVLR